MHVEPGTREFRSGLLANLSLLESDLETFVRFGIGPVLLADAGVRRVTDAEAFHRYEIRFVRDKAGIVLPYLDPETENRCTAFASHFRSVVVFIRELAGTNVGGGRDL